MDQVSPVVARPKGALEDLSELDGLLAKVKRSLHVFIHGEGAKADSTPEPKPLSDLGKLRQKAEQSLKQLGTILAAIRAPLPTQTGDGSGLPAEPKKSTLIMIEEFLEDLYHLGKNASDLVIVAEKMKKGELIDDKDYWMERLIKAAAILPDDDLEQKVTDGFLTVLWNDLQHPPQTLLGEGVAPKLQDLGRSAGKSPYQFRQPDGSHNNYLYPHIGAAGMPYARTVAPKTKPAGNLPDPSVLFDTVMARKNPEGTEHPNKVSSILFYLASVIIHDIFRTNHDDYNISDTSSYLDLAPLYGSTWEDQKRMRTFKDGKLHPDCFSETRLLIFPPGVGVLLIMFNRYHNYVVEQLALINEDGRFTEDAELEKREVERYGETINKREDDLFQTARLITCGLYINIILIDYVRTILNLNRTNENWQLNPRVDIPNGPPQATGNQVSAEFNLIYRWHAAISKRDDAWTQDLMKEYFRDFDPHDAADPKALGQFLKSLDKMEKNLMKKEPLDRPFPALAKERERLPRNKDGPYKDSFPDNGLANILTAGIEDCANAFGPQQVPTVMKVIEILGIMQARTWHVSTLNEFRKHFSLEPHREFKDITANEEVQAALKHFYDTPDNVELYPGLVVEDAKRPYLPGSGLCPGYTVSRGVLSDAVSLVRGDRFYTTSYTPAALTNWGFTEASSDPTIDNGCVFYKLFLRVLPNNYDPASVYVHYPMTVPHGNNGMIEVLEDLGKGDKYNFDKPSSIPQPTVIFSYKAVHEILNNQKDFYVTWGPAIEYLMGPDGKNFMLAGDGEKNAVSRKLMEKALYIDGSSRKVPEGNEKWLQAVKAYYEETTIQLLKEKSYPIGPGKTQVDIIRDVGNMAHVHFGAELFGLPLKTEKFQDGIFTEQQLYVVMAAVFICVFFDVDPPKSFPLRQQAKDAIQQVGQIVKIIVFALKATEKLPKWATAEQILSLINKPSTPLREYGLHMVGKLVEEDPDVNDLVWGNIMATCGGMVANQGQLFGQVLDFFFSTGKGLNEYWPKVQDLAKRDDDKAFDELQHWLMEASRLNGETGVFRWVENDSIKIEDTFEIGGKKRTETYTFKKDDKIMLDLRAASHDPQKFGQYADEVNLNIPFEDYLHLGHGPHQCLGWNMTRIALTTMLKVVARLEGLAPARVALGGKSVPSSVKKVLKEFIPGDLAWMPENWHYHQYLTEDWGMYLPFPTSLKVTWSGNIPEVKGNATNASSGNAGL